MPISAWRCWCRSSTLRDDRGRRVLAWLVYRYLGLKFISRSWFNLETIWAASLILVGSIALTINVA